MSKSSSYIVALFIVAVSAVTAGCSSNPAPPISVSLSPSTAKAIDESQTVAITATVANDTSYQGVKWSLNGQGTLSSSIGPNVTYTSPASTLTNAEQAIVTATSIKDPSKSASLQITVNPYPELPLVETLANGSVGSPYNQAVTFTGGTAPFQWSVYNGPTPSGWKVGGSVPDGLTLDPNSGSVSGTPTDGGTWYFRATMTDAAGVTETCDVSVEIKFNAPPANPVPFLNQTLVPTSVSPGSLGAVLSVSGAGFVSGATVDFNAAPLATTVVDSDHLTAIIPATDVATAGTASVTVMNPAPGGGRSNVVYFEIGTPQATASFVNAPNSPLQTNGAFELSAADFNEDGKPDLAISSGIRVYVMLGKGDGTFVPAAGSPLSVPSPPYDDFPSPYTAAVSPGDFNNSGHLGLAVGLFQNEAAAILFGNGDGTFTYSSTLANTLGEPTMSLTPADYNQDGNLDLVAINNISGVSPVVLLGYGHGAFNMADQNTQISGLSSAAGDFNGDGKLDVAVGGNVLLGNGDGTFTQGTAGLNGGFVTAGDFNGDGKLDLALCNSAQNIVTIFLGDGSGNFTAASGSPIPVGNQPWAIVAADFNNDGKLDLAIPNNGDGTLTLLLGNGDGTFTQAGGSPFEVGNAPSAVVAADFNGDGKLDLAVTNELDGTVSILLQQ